MQRLKYLTLIMIMALGFTTIAIGQDDVAEVRFLWYSDGNEGEVMRDLLDRFEAENPDIRVILDEVPYGTIRDNLRVQVEAGEAPDMARITDFGGMASYYLDLRPHLEDASLLEDNFNAAVFDAFREDADDDGLYGFPDTLAITAPYVNKTLFDQAEVDLPDEDATWEEWIEALKTVAEAADIDYAFAIDNKGHRFAGPAMSLGAEFFDEDGNFDLEDEEGFRTFATYLKDWLDNGISPREIWLGGGEYEAAQDYFINVATVMYFSGSWQVGRFANDIDDAFDWIVVPNPTGPGGSTGVSGGAGIVGFGQTEYPEAVARIMDYLIDPDVYGEYVGRSLFIPAHETVIENGVEYDTESELAADALNAFGREVPKLQPQAIQLNLHPLAFAYYDGSNNRLAQYFAEELTLDEAMERMQQQLDEAADS